MRRSLVSLLSLTLGLPLLLAPARAWAVTGGEIITMVQAGVPDSVILGQIQAGAGSLVLAPGEIQAIQAAGASPAVMRALTPAPPAAAAPVGTPAAAPAQPKASVTAPTTAVQGPLEFTVGIKGGVNGAYLVPETEFESVAAEVTFGDQDAGGVGGHAGLYAQVRLWRAVGVELGVGWSRENLWRTVDVGVDIDHTDWSDNLRVPLLLKGFLAFEHVSLSLGVGPEYVKMLDNGHEVEAGNVIPKEELAKYGDTFTSVAEDMLFLLGQLEVTIELDSISIPIALRAGKNLNQTDKFEDRFTYTTGVNPQGQAVVTSHRVKPIYTWDFRFSTGVGVKF